MKRFIKIVVLVNLFTIGLLVYIHVAFGGELEEKQLEYRACIMEINYCDQRIKVLQNEAKRLESEITVLMNEKKKVEDIERAESIDAETEE